MGGRSGGTREIADANERKKEGKRGGGKLLIRVDGALNRVSEWCNGHPRALRLDGARGIMLCCALVAFLAFSFFALGHYKAGVCR